MKFGQNLVLLMTNISNSFLVLLFLVLLPFMILTKYKYHALSSFFVDDGKY